MARPLTIVPCFSSLLEGFHRTCGRTLVVAAVLASGLDAEDARLPRAEDGSHEPHEASPAVLPELDAARGVDATFLPPDAEARPAGPGGTATVRHRAPVELPSPAVLLPPRAVAVKLPRAARVSFDGNTLFDDEVLAAEIVTFLNRELGPEDLDEICHRLTLFHVDRGYVNSGATIPDREVRDDELKIRITEGRLTTVIVQGNQHLAAWYLERRALRDRGRPLDFPALQRRLQVLQTDPNVRRINAELKPGHLPGEATLLMEIEENTAWLWGVDFHNQRPPDTGAEQVDLWASCQNLTGAGDSLLLRQGLLSGGFEEPSFSGLDNLHGRYRLPVTAGDTQLELGVETRDYLVIDQAFRSLDIEGTSWRINGGFRHPLFRSFDNAAWVQNELWLSLLLECQHSEASLLGEPFSTSPGYVNGELDLTILRFSQEWTRRTRSSVLALQSTLSIGLDFLDPTESRIGPDNEFVAWRLNGQYLTRMSERGDLLVVNGGLQVAGDPLPSPEQWTSGGRYTVRGYRENSVVSDNGVFAGVEYRLPLRATGESGDWRVSVAPFVDAGFAWNDDTARDDWLVSAGLGLLIEYKDLARGEIYWGKPFREEDPRSGNLQDEGIHFRFTLTLF